MTKKTRAQLKAEKMLEDLGRVMNSYNELHEKVKKMRPFTEFDYETAEKEIVRCVAKTEDIYEEFKKSKIEIEHLESLFTSLLKTEKYLERIIQGLGDKAQRRRRYGWFRYRKDYKDYSFARDVYVACAQAFSQNIYNESSDEKVNVTAWVSDVMQDEPYQEEIELLKSDYIKLRDEKGFVYINRFLDNGETKDTLLEKDMWTAIHNALYVSPEEQKRQTQQLLDEFLGKKKE